MDIGAKRIFLKNFSEYLCPLLYILLTVNRYILICHPNKVAELCSRMKTMVFLSLAVGLSFSLSFSESFQTPLDNTLEKMSQILEKKWVQRKYENFKVEHILHYIKIFSMSGINVFSVVLILTLTARMNSELLKMIAFLKTMDGNALIKKRIDSYAKLITFNMALVVSSSVFLTLNTVNLTLQRAEEVVEEFSTYYAYGLVRPILEVLSSLEIVAYPLHIAFFLPSFTKTLKAIGRRFRGCFRPK